METEQASAGALRMFTAWMQNQFEKRVEYLPLISIPNRGFQRILPSEVPKMHLGFAQNSDWIVPVRYNGSSLGQVRIKDGTLLSEPTLTRISHYIDLGLAPALFRQHLEVKISNIQLNHESTELNLENIEMLAPSHFKSFNEEEQDNGSAAAVVTPALIELYGSEGFRFRKIAFEIKNHYSHLLAFIDLKDIAAEIKNVEDVWSLHNICLYADQFSNMDESLKKILNDYLAEIWKNPNRERPLLILSDEKAASFHELLSIDIPARKSFSTDHWPMRAAELTKVLDLILD